MSHQNSNCDNEEKESTVVYTEKKESTVVDNQSSKSSINLPEKQENPEKMDSLKPKPQIIRNRRTRTLFSPVQINTLEKEFIQNNFVNRTRRQSIGNQLDLSETTVKVWFQNRRMKDKRLTPVWPFPLVKSSQMMHYMNETYKQSLFQNMASSYMACSNYGISLCGSLPCHQNFPVTSPPDYGYNTFHHSQYQPPSSSYLPSIQMPMHGNGISSPTGTPSSYPSTPSNYPFALTSYPSTPSGYPSTPASYPPTPTDSIPSPMTSFSSTFSPFLSELSSNSGYDPSVNNFYHAQNSDRTVVPSVPPALSSQAPPKRPNFLNLKSTYNVATSPFNNNYQHVPTDPPPARCSQAVTSTTTTTTKLFQPYT